MEEPVKDEKTKVETEAENAPLITGKNPYLIKAYSRWIFLLLLTIIESTNILGTDYPAPLQSYLMGSDLGMTSVQYNSLGSVSFVATAIACFSGGHFVNLFGPDKALYVITGCHALGLLFFCLGVVLKFIPIMIFGRIFNGIGEANFLCYTLLMETWFKNLENSLSFSVLLNGGRFFAYGYTYALSMMRIYTNSLIGTYSLALAMSCFSIFLTFLINFFGKRYLVENAYKSQQMEDELIVETTFAKYAKKQWEYFKEMSVDVYLMSLGTAMFAMVLIIYMLNYNAFFTKVFYTAPEESVFFFFLSVVFCFPFSFICSLFLDRFGYRLYFLFLGPLSMIAQYLLMGLMDREYVNTSKLIWLLYPVAYTALSSAYWPLLNNLLPKHLISTAPGLYYIPNYGLNTIVSILYGVIKDATIDNREGYFWSSHFTHIFSFLSIICFVIVAVRNHRLKLNLNAAKIVKA